MELFGVGPAEALLVLVIALIVIGPQRFPQYAREAAKWYRIGRRYAREITDEIRGAVGELDAEAGGTSGFGGVLGGLHEVRDLARDLTDSARADLRAVRDDTERLGITAPAATASTTSSDGGLQAPRELPASDTGTDSDAGGTFVTHATVLEIPGFSAASMSASSESSEPEPVAADAAPPHADQAPRA